MSDMNVSGVVIPNTSVLAKVRRGGVEGMCVACGQRVTAHVDHRGNWVGCAGAERTSQTYLLIPDRREVVRAMSALLPSGRTPEPREGVSTPPTPQSRPGASSRVSGVVYKAAGRYAQKVVEDLPPADRALWQLVARRPEKGWTRQELLRATDALKATGRVDGAVRRLRLRKLVTVERR